jgi:hypothetical protein
VLLPAAVALPLAQMAEVYEPAPGLEQEVVPVFVPKEVALPDTQTVLV